jgi:surface antigen
MASRKIGRLLLVTGTLSICSYLLLARNTHTLPSIALTNPITRSIGDKVDSFNNVYVYYNGSIGHVLERHISKDGYNLGLKYQCVEFVKRYYYQYYKHKMPDSYGHAKDFFNKNLSDGAFNKGRNLRQFSNPSSTKPKIGDILVFDGHEFNPYGHVAIVTAVSNETIEIIQQNPGPNAPSRETLSIYQSVNQFEIEDGLGWLGKR